MNALTVRQVRQRYLVLHGLRWLPVGLLFPVLILLMQERGLSLAQIGLILAAQGVVVLVLELPTGGLADALGRRPVLLAAAGLHLATLVLLAVADTIALFLLVFLLQGVHRALDSGPLDSWYVDTTLAADPAAEFERGLSAGGVVTGLAIGAGALLGGALVALGPVGPASALTVPVAAAVVLQLGALVGHLLLLVEVRPPGGRAAWGASLRAVPATVGGAVGLLRRSRVLTALLCVELFWGFGMVTFEGLLPVRLAEVVGNPDQAAVLLGPASTAAWLASAAGAALAVPVSRRIGAAPTAALLRLLHGGTVVGMALLAGPVGVLVAYLACYTVHGAANPLHMGLLHRQVEGPYRTSVISLNSMVSLPAGALGGVLLTLLAEATTISVALLVGAVVLACAAPFYLPAWRAGRRTARPADDRDACGDDDPAGTAGTADGGHPPGAGDLPGDRHPPDLSGQVGSGTRTSAGQRG